MSLPALHHSCFTSPMRLLNCLLTVCLVASCSGESKPITPSNPEGTVTLEDIDVPNQSTAMEGVLTAGQLSEEQMVALAGLGYESFISLREAHEGGSGWEEEFAAEKGIHFVRLPIAGADGIDDPTRASSTSSWRPRRARWCSTAAAATGSGRCWR